MTPKSMARFYDYVRHYFGGEPTAVATDPPKTADVELDPDPSAGAAAASEDEQTPSMETEPEAEAK